MSLEPNDCLRQSFISVSRQLVEATRLASGEKVAILAAPGRLHLQMRCPCSAVEKSMREEEPMRSSSSEPQLSVFTCVFSSGMAISNARDHCTLHQTAFAHIQELVQP